MRSIIIPHIEYLLKLTNAEGKLIYLTPRKTFALGKYKLVLNVNIYNYSIFDDLNCSNDSFLENHMLNLVTLICKQYLKVRLHYVETSLEVSKRRLLTKLIFFNHR